MLRQLLQGGRSGPEGTTINRVRVYGLVNSLAFLGRRRRVYDQLAERSGARPGDRVLDVGCSGGYFARRLAARVGAGGRVTGVDPSGPAIAYANQKAPGNCTFVVGAAQALDLPDGAFDVVTSTLALHHIPEPDRPAALAEMYRVLRPGGRLLIADLRRGGHAGLVHHHRDGAPLEPQIAAAGFEVRSAGDLPMLRYVEAVRPS